MSAADQPLRLRWVRLKSGLGVFVAAQPAVQERFERELEFGVVYEFLEHKARNVNFEKKYHACVRKAFENLPADKAAEFTSATHLRKAALIKLSIEGVGDWASVRDIPQESEEAAVRALANYKPGDRYAIVQVHGSCLRVFTARTQRATGAGAMSAKAFKESAEAVLHLLADMIGVDYETLLSWEGHET